MNLRDERPGLAIPKHTNSSSVILLRTEDADGFQPSHTGSLDWDDCTTTGLITPAYSSAPLGTFTFEQTPTDTESLFLSPVASPGEANSGSNFEQNDKGSRKSSQSLRVFVKDQKAEPLLEREGKQEEPVEATYIPHESHEEWPMKVELKPYKHQVGGHTALFRFSKRAICKPLFNEENTFYETIETQHAELLPFVPRYIGVLNVKLPSHKRMPEVLLHKNRHILPESMLRFSSSAPDSSEWKKGQRRRHTSLGSTTVNRVLQEQVLREVFSPRLSSLRQERTASSPDLRRKEPIVLQSLKKLTLSDEEGEDGVFKMEEENWNSRLIARPSADNERFILLEDLTSGMSKPCVLDFKMGTRQYGIYASETKKQSMMKKCKTTTSRELGVRICGMQFWDPHSQSYSFEDKYVGRDIQPGLEFRDALCRFLSTRENVLRHVPVILEKLSYLENIVRQLVGYRLYASSLLLLYDGQKPNEKLRIKTVDFANSVTAEQGVSKNAPCPPKGGPGSVDRGYIRGLRSLRVYFHRYVHTFRNSC